MFRTVGPRMGTHVLDLARELLRSRNEAYKAILPRIEPPASANYVFEKRKLPTGVKKQ
jgi:hypothetical protein